MENENIPYVILLSKATPRPITLVPEDPGSRYKVRQLQSQNVGKNKMLKTVLVNILDVSKEMQLPHPSYLVNYLGYELNVTPHFYEKQPPRQQAVLSGEHFPDVLSPLVQKFIKEFLLCTNCGLPELLHAVKGKKITARCRSCGTTQDIVINNEKFHRFVINHPPTKSDNAFKGNNKVAENKGGAVDKKEPKKEKKERSPREGTPGDEDAIEWFSDVSEEAVQKRLKENVPDLLLKEQTAAIDPKELRLLVKAEDPATLGLFKAQNGLDDGVFASLLFDALYGDKEIDAKSLVQSFTDMKAIFAKFLKPSEAQIAFLTKLELLVNGKPLTKSMAPLLQKLYGADLVDEENIIEWFDQCSNDAVCAAAKPMIDWLNQDSEESDQE